MGNSEEQGRGVEIHLRERKLRVLEEVVTNPCATAAASKGSKSKSYSVSAGTGIDGDEIAASFRGGVPGEPRGCLGDLDGVWRPGLRRSPAARDRGPYSRPGRIP
jgi:hypothetical protein